ncbi:MAG: Mur ligase domain-containing protein, partial [Cyclobacteriaceae bacterium]|nr:Mur ligase domain-containing protein [Cyclobacteriaceae bacterium]
MLLKDLLYKVSITSRVGDVNIEVEGISFNSESIRKNHLFVAVRGTKTDGHHYILSAIGKGATVIVCEELPENLPEGITYITVAESTAALGIMSTNFYGDPSNKLVLTGVTGT